MKPEVGDLVQKKARPEHIGLAMEEIGAGIFRRLRVRCLGSDGRPGRAEFIRYTDELMIMIKRWDIIMGVPRNTLVLEDEA